MSLRIDRKHSIRHPIDHPAAKERPVAIELRLVQIGNKAQQVVVGGSGGKRQVPDVVVGVPARHLSEMGHAANQELRHIVERRRRRAGPVRLHDLAHDGPTAGRLFEQQHRADVRRAGR